METLRPHVAGRARVGVEAVGQHTVGGGVGVHAVSMRFPSFRRSTTTPTDPATTAATTTDRPTAEGEPRLVVYGGSWCVDCHVVTRYLDRHKVPYRWVDLARDHEAQERLTAMGYRAIPVVVLPDGRTFVEPSTDELARALGHA